MTVNFEHYKIFYTVAKEGSITSAAKALFISQPAVSKTVKVLEKEVGCALFVRSKKGIELTTEGKVLYNYVAKALEQVALGEKRLNDLLNLDDGILRLGASDMVARFFMLTYLEKFHIEYPGIRINMQSGSTPAMVEALRGEHIELGIVSSPVDAKDDITVYPLIEVQDIFVAGNTFRALETKTLSIKEMMNYPIICTEKNTASRLHLDRFFLEQKIVLDPAFELGSVEMVEPYTKRNLGIGIVVKEFVAKQLEEGHIFEVKTAITIPKRQICLITHKKGTLSRAGQAFLTELLHDDQSSTRYP
ncbi:MAG: LysR family transcriptional regulator [Eubacterium sp.]